MSDVMGRVEEAVTELESAVASIEKVQAVHESAKAVAKVLDRLSKTADEMTDETKSALTKALGEDGLGIWSGIIDGVRVIMPLIGGGDGGGDVDDGPARRIKAMFSGEVFDLLGDKAIEDRATKALEAWGEVAKTKRGSGGRDGSHAANPLGFTVKVICEHAGCEWNATTTKDNLNSIRHQAIKHSRDVHNVDVKAGEGAGGELHKGLTDALDSAMHKGKPNTQGGGFRVARSKA